MPEGARMPEGVRMPEGARMRRALNVRHVVCVAWSAVRRTDEKIFRSTCTSDCQTLRGRPTSGRFSRSP